MAVVFISPRQKQKKFFLAITALFMLVVAGVSLFVFLSQPSENQAQLVFNKPKVDIDFKVLDSGQFLNLEPFSKMELQFAYHATDEDGKALQGFISAVSAEEAQKKLEASGLKVLDVRESAAGRSNPFIPY